MKMAFNAVTRYYLDGVTCFKISRIEFTYSMYRHKALCETTREVHLILTHLAGIDCRVWELCEEILDESTWILGGTMEPSWSGAGPAHTYKRPCCPTVQACVHVGL